MTTLQGVIILRISDFRRFFDWNEFWTKKEEFISIFRSEIARRTESKNIKELQKYYFVDNDSEFYLMRKLHEWLVDPAHGQESLRVRLDPAELRMEGDKGEKLVYPLGRLCEKIAAAQKKLTSKTILGYTLLYLLLGAEKKNSDIRIEYNDTGLAEIRGYNLCSNDVVLEPTTDSSPLRRCIFVNVNPDRDIKVTSGNDSSVLERGACVVGVFCGNKCYRLLPNLLTGANSNITLKLMSSSSNNATKLEIHDPDEVKVVDDVVSIGLDSIGRPFYMRASGEVYIEPMNFNLRNQYSGFLKNYKATDAVAIEIAGNGYLSIYTAENGIYG